MRPLAAIALVFASTACFATRNDVRILQGDIFALKEQQARADSMRARQLADLATAIDNTLGIVRDSLQEFGERLTALQGATRTELYAMGQQLLRMEEFLGRNAADMARFRADLEQRNQALLEQQMRAAATAAAPPAAPGDTTTPATPPPIVVGEGPNVLYQIGRDQLMAGAYSSAREALGQVLARFPDDPLAPDAQLAIAESFAAERARLAGDQAGRPYQQKLAEEDSSYRLVYDTYPRSPAAPTAMYKLGLSLDRQGKIAEARAMMQRVIREYPSSDSYNLASDWLKSHP